MGPGRHRHRLRGPLAVAERGRHRLQEPDDAGDRQPDLRAEDPQGPLRQRLRADDGAGDLLRADGLPVLRLRAVQRPGPALRGLPAGDLRPAQRPDAAARPGLQLRADHGSGQPVPHHGRRGLPHRDDRHAAHRLPGGGQHRQHVPGAGPLSGRHRPARLGQRGQRLHRPGRGRPGAGLPDQEDQLRRIRHPRHLAGAARPDDMVGQLGPLLELGVLEQFPQLLRLTPDSAPVRVRPGPEGGDRAVRFFDVGVMKMNRLTLKGVAVTAGEPGDGRAPGLRRLDPLVSVRTLRVSRRHPPE
ncbi:hypothetical protein SBRY_10836 [Actinacidiphila bryophytorum]|uniref:Uncharacterized protein n=1 Tax=Actinacidiphila bryophytorum TaxID=1436133 RepID=A0A9W4E3Q8_9ACTN|nr:hypothetical protein SBRY_10836 [Actinacidiphila bryophytorum]